MNFYSHFEYLNITFNFEILAQNFFLMTLGIRKRRATQCETITKRKSKYFYLLTGNTDILLAISNSSVLDSLSLTT